MELKEYLHYHQNIFDMTLGIHYMELKAELIEEKMYVMPATRENPLHGVESVLPETELEQLVDKHESITWS